MDNFRRPRAGNVRRVTMPVAGPSPNDSAKGNAPETSEPLAKTSRIKRLHKKIISSSWRQRLILGTGALVVAIGLFFGTKLFLAAKNIMARNTTGGAPALTGKVKPNLLKGEGDGRINILLLGIGGKGWDGPQLSDTMMVLSIDPRNKDLAILSIPRDLYVKIPNYGWSKIHAANAVGESKQAGNGPVLARTVVQNVLGIPIHYYARVDFAGFKKAVDTVGGVDINVTKALYDPYYPGGTVNFKTGYQHFNGNQALQYARSRKTTSDFDRATRQQQILMALKTKALSLKTIANPAKLAGLIDAFGSSILTDLRISDLKKLLEIAQKIDSTKVTTRVLDTSPGGLLVFGDVPGAGSIEIPAAGIGNYSAIQQFARSIFTDSYIISENATIEVQNGTLQVGLATTVGNLLKSYNYNVVSVVPAPQQNHSQIKVYDYTGGQKPYTVNYLENRFGVKASRPARGPSDPDLRIVIGSDYKAPASTNN